MTTEIPDDIYEAALSEAELDGEGFAVGKADGWTIAWKVTETWHAPGAYGAMCVHFEVGDVEWATGPDGREWNG